MGDRWMDERDREWRERDWRRSEAYGRGEDLSRAGEARPYEDRSWAGPQDEYPHEERGRWRVYGYGDEDYGGRSRLTAGGAGPPSSAAEGAGAGAQFASQDYTGRRDAEERGPPRRGFDYGGADDYSYVRSYRDERNREHLLARDRQARELERRYADDLRRRPAPGGAYDYERGYADADRPEQAGDFLQRAGQRISSWIRGEQPMRGSREESPEPGIHRGVGPKGYQRSDERISDEAHDRLTDDPWLDASNIELVVRAGEITLSGHVENRDAKHRAEHLVEDLSGVRHVQNNLRVDPHAGFTGAGRGFGSSAVEAEMRRNEPAPGAEGHEPSGLWGRTSTGARAEQGTKRS